MVVMTIVGTGLAGLLANQMRFQQIEDAMRDSRSGARAALNVLTSDLRMLEGDGALAAAAARDITVRAPYSFGVVCASSAAQTDVSLLPADSTTYATAGISGWAWRDAATGVWSYQDAAPAVTSPGDASCTAASVTVIANGRVVRLAPGLAGLAVGSPVMLYQRVRYRFDESDAFPGRDALYRTVVASNQESELVAPFAGTARFRFYTNWTTPQDNVPADLTTIVGLEIGLDAESAADSPRLGEPEPFSLNTSVFFKNATN
jgi:hypothetical protein